MKKLIKYKAKVILTKLGYEVRSLDSGEKAAGFPTYLRKARESQMDVNDWEEQVLGWGDSLPILYRVVFPHLRDDSVVCELGFGTGRFSRHIAAKLTKGSLHLVDHSPWIVRFGRHYFSTSPNVRVHLCDGYSLPLRNDSWADLVFSTGTFTALTLGYLHLYTKEFYRILKPGGLCIIDYLDAATEEGLNHLRTREAEWETACYSYHHREVVDEIFRFAGFEVLGRQQYGKSTYLTSRKPEAGGNLRCGG